jgi:hypothetical protein
VEPGKYLTFGPNTSSAYSFDQVTLPLSVGYLHTTYYRLHSGIQPSEEIKRYVALAWEILNILREHFPSKLLLFQENL